MSDVVHDSDIGRRRRERAVGAVEHIDGVVAATVKLGAGTRIDSVRLVITAGESAESTRTRAVEALRGLGYDVEPAGIQVLPVDGTAPAVVRPNPSAPAAARAPAVEAPSPGLSLAEDEPHEIEDQGPPPAWHGRFLVLEGVDVHRSDARVVCTVRLKRLGELFSAEVQELDTPHGRARAAARAALLAAEKSGEGVGLSLEGVVLQEFFGREYVMVFVDGIAHRRHASLCGILNVEQSVETAAVLSVLRAVERWVAW